MSTAVADLQQAPTEPRVNYLNATYGIRSWLLTLDHKRIGLLYLGSITLMFFVGGMAAVLMRLHSLPGASGLAALFEPETYNKMFSTHGIIMVFFFLVPSIPATLGNFLIPLMIGARDVAFPRLNLMSWYIFITGAALALGGPPRFSGGTLIPGGRSYPALQQRCPVRTPTSPSWRWVFSSPAFPQSSPA